MKRLVVETRTRTFAVDVIRFAAEMPRNQLTQIICSQLIRSATSVGANYREANRAESRRDFGHKVAIVEKEAAETLYLFELCKEIPLGDSRDLARLAQECNELLAIFTKVGKTTKRILQSAIRNPQAAFPS